LQLLPAQPSGLYEEVWREAFQQGGLELIDFPDTALDCGTIEGYLRQTFWRTTAEASLVKVQW
jgi:hypothetical protein